MHAAELIAVSSQLHFVASLLAESAMRHASTCYCKEGIAPGALSEALPKGLAVPVLHKGSSALLLQASS